MNELQQKINHLKSEMNQNRKRLRMHAVRIKKWTHSTPFIVTGAACGFVGGLLLAKKRNAPQLLQFVRTVASASRKVKRSVKLLSLLLF
jgi:hypothetical protein